MLWSIYRLIGSTHKLFYQSMVHSDGRAKISIPLRLAKTGGKSPRVSIGDLAFSFSRKSLNESARVALGAFKDTMRRTLQK